MGKKAQHNISFGLNGKPKQNTEVVTIYLSYSYGSTNRHKTSTEITIQAKYWDNSKNVKAFKKSCPDYETLQLQLAEYKKKALECKPNLRSGKMMWSSAFDYILNKQKQNDDTLKNWLQTSTKATQVKKYTSYINAIEKHLTDNGLKKFVPLKFSILNDNKAVEKIATSLLGSGKKSTTINNYMKAVDSICTKAKNINSKPFANEEMIPSVAYESSKEGRTHKDIYDSLIKIKTLQDYEALIFWLYQFSLRGLNVGDIANISQERLATDNNNHFYPDYNVLPHPNRYKNKNYFTTKRKKTKDKGVSDLKVVINLFPSITLHKVLKRLISISHKQYAYKGEDKFRLFNFTALDSNDKEDKDGMNKVKSYRDTISTKLRKLIGAGTGNTRHTFTQTAERITNVKEIDLNRILGHSTKNVVNHYTSDGQIGVDLIHIQTLEDYGFINVVDNVLKWGSKHFEEINNKKVYYVEPFNYKTRKGFIIVNDSIDVEEKQLFELKTYNSWSYEKELQYQNLVHSYKAKIDAFVTDDGILIRKEQKLPKELQELIKEKQAILSGKA